MHPLAERWASGHPRWRAASWLGISLMSSAAAVWLSHQQAGAQRSLAADAQQFQQQFRVQQRRLQVLAEAAVSAPLPARPGFPVLGFAAANGGAFIAWQPEAAGGPELTLALPWDQVAQLFPRLMQYAVELRGFSLVAGPRDLRLNLALTLEPE
ncbi:DNA utilization protein HofO [Shimwellia pseudoproteus]|uniref:HofO family protein n=1 Tax=Shimwellia pseudoproteus TaxID=570012 RepID=UPI0018EBE762|nr:DNA utilization protein HofO [Shimwellia pseudoproteus]MBJ3815011.1 DNA utilization protein HofO [Shimwellia pseudoproteus]